MQLTKHIQAYGLYDYTIQVTQAVLEGYRPSDINEYFPQSIGIGMYCAILVKDEDDLEPEHEAVVVPPVPVVGGGEAVAAVKQRKGKATQAVAAVH